MRAATTLLIPLCTAVLGLPAGNPDGLSLIGAPDAPPTLIFPDGSLHEDWGNVRVHLVEPAATATSAPHFTALPVPTVSYSLTGPSVAVEVKMWRAPIWPAGADIIEVRTANQGPRRMRVRLRLALPAAAAVGDRSVALGGRTVLVLPPDAEPKLKTRQWGCTGEAIAMPGWAKPARPCDPAFRNIRAGMGGVPIVYYFSVPPAAARTVALGLCESYWSAPGSRPLRIAVEGAPTIQVDPLGRWGQHIPGVLLFAAADVDGDGRLKIVVTTPENAPDRNPILNVIWIFRRGLLAKPDDILAGRLNGAAEYYVDVGGQHDQLYYQPGHVDYVIDLDAQKHRTLMFAVAPRGCSLSGQLWQNWDIAAMARAAEEVWRPWLRPILARFGTRPATAESRQRAEICARAAELVAMTRYQENAFYAALPAPAGLPDFSARRSSATRQPQARSLQAAGLEHFSHAQAALIVAALDAMGLHAQAEQLLRFLWDARAPKTFSSLRQDRQGIFRDPSADPSAHVCALDALVRHALVSEDLVWARAAWPTIRSAAQAAARVASTTKDTKIRRRYAQALLGAAKLAAKLGALSDAATFTAAARAIDPQARWSKFPSIRPRGPVPEAAAQALEALLRWRQ